MLNIILFLSLLFLDGLATSIYYWKGNSLCQYYFLFDGEHCFCKRGSQSQGQGQNLANVHVQCHYYVNETVIQNGLSSGLKTES